MRAVTNLAENTDLTTSVMGMAFHWTITTIFNICQSPHTVVVSFLCEKGVRCSLGFISLCLSCNELGGL